MFVLGAKELLLMLRGIDACNGTTKKPPLSPSLIERRVSDAGLLASLLPRSTPTMGSPLQRSLSEEMYLRSGDVQNFLCESGTGVHSARAARRETPTDLAPLRGETEKESPPGKVLIEACLRGRHGKVPPK